MNIGMHGKRYFSSYPCCPGRAGGQREEGGDGLQHVDKEHHKFLNLFNQDIVIVRALLHG